MTVEEVLEMRTREFLEKHPEIKSQELYQEILELIKESFEDGFQYGRN